MLITNVLQAGMNSLFSLVYVTQIFAYAPALVVPALLVILLNLIVGTAASLLQMRIMVKQP